MKLVRQASGKIEFAGDVKETIEYTIAAEDMGYLFELLSKYSDIIGSIVREITSNAIDARLELQAYQNLSLDEIRENYEYLSKLSDKKLTQIKDYYSKAIDRKVEVRIEGTGAIDNYPTLVIEDWGTGMSYNRVAFVFSNYFASTKRKTNTQIGCFGLGSKSPLGYNAKLFSLDTVFHGEKFEWVIRAGEDKPIIELYDRYPTDEPDGTKISIPIMEGDIYRFQKAILLQLAYFDDIAFINCDVDDDYQILRGNHFIYRTKTPYADLHVCLGKVYYPINYSSMGWSYYMKGRDTPIGLYFPMEEISNIDVTRTRESLEYSPRTITAIKQKLFDAQVELQLLADGRNEPVYDVIEYYKALEQGDDKKQGEIYPGIWVENLGALINLRKVELGGYDHITPPKDPFYLLYKIRDRVGVKGKLKHRNQDIQLYKNIIKPEARSYCYYRSNRDTSLNGQTNKYIGRNGNAYIIEQREIDIKTGYWERDIKHSFVVENLNAPELKEIRRFIKCIKKAVEEKIPAYEDVLIDPAWLEHQKQLRAYRKRIKKDGEITIKEIYWNSPYEIKQGRPEYGWYMYNVMFSEYFKGKMPNAHNLPQRYLGRLIIWGTHSDEKNLFHATSIIRKQKHLSSIHSSLNKQVIEVIKISVKTAELISQMDNAIHVSDFLSLRKKASVIRRVLTAYKLHSILISKILPLSVPSIKKVLPEVYDVAFKLSSYIINSTKDIDSHPLDDELIDFFDNYEKKRRAMIRRAKKLGKPMPRMEPAYDYDMIALATQVSAVLEKYSLLPYIDLSKIPEDVVKSYIDSLSPIEPRLLKRFKVKKNVKKT